MSTTTSEAERTRPVPPQAWQGSATTRPVPSHSGHCTCMAPKPMPPKMDERSMSMVPVPPQVGHTLACSASSEPEPWQTSQVT